MICTNCNESYGPQFDADFTDGVCLPCIVHAEHQEHEAKEKAQLDRWNKKFGKDLSIDDFYFECPDSIKREDLKGFPLLRQIWDWMDMEKDGEWGNDNMQLSLFESVGDGLPF